MFELFEYNFFVNAIIAGSFLAIITALLSFFVVLKKFSYYSVGISHTVVSFGLLTGLNPILSAVGIGKVTQNKRISEDNAIGIFFTSAMALGIVFISLIKNYTVNAMAYLFGDILAISKTDIYLIALLSIFIILSIFFLFKYLLIYIFDEELAKTINIPVKFLNFFLLTMMAVVIVLSIKSIGIVLVSALLVILGNTAYMISKKYKKMLVLTIIFSLFSVYFGILISYKFDIPSGATIVLVNSFIFLIIYTFNLLFNKKKI